MIDSHCHLDSDRFDGDRPAVLARACDAGVRAIVIPAIRPSTWPGLSKLVRDWKGTPSLHLAVGVHPQVVPELTAEELRFIDDDGEALAQAARAMGAVAIGECGLDGMTAEPELQARVLRAHIRAARATGLPLLLHVYRAHGAAPKLLAEERVDQCGGVLHSYSGGRDLVVRYLRMGLHLSFAGPVTYPNARRPLEAARAVPLDRLLVETDAPDQAPAPHQGARSEPAYVGLIVRAMAEARGEDANALVAATSENARRLFRIGMKER